MKLLIVGAGYVGMALLHYLKDKEHEIYVTTTDENRVGLLKDSAKEVILLKSSEDLERAVEKCDGMILLIAPKNKQSYEDTYLAMARRISSILKERKKPFYLLYTSSTGVYEGIEDEWAREDVVLNPISENGKILLETENLLLECATTCVLRLGGIFGPDREIEVRALRLSNKELPGTGKEPTNHIHQEDIVSAIAFCLEHHLSGIYNLVNNDHPLRKELYPLCRWNKDLSHNKKNYKVSNQKIVAAGFTTSMHSI